MSWRSLVEINHDYPLTDESVRQLRDFLRSTDQGRGLPRGIRYLWTRHHSSPDFAKAGDLADRLQALIDAFRITGKRELLLEVLPNVIRYLRLVEGATHPKADIEVRKNPDGSIDEIVANAKFFHIEQMGATHWWIGVDLPDGRLWHVNLHSKASIRIHAEEAHGPTASDKSAP